MPSNQKGRGNNHSKMERTLKLEMSKWATKPFYSHIIALYPRLIEKQKWSHDAQKQFKILSYTYSKFYSQTLSKSALRIPWIHKIRSLVQRERERWLHQGHTGMHDNLPCTLQQALSFNVVLKHYLHENKESEKEGGGGGENQMWDGLLLHVKPSEYNCCSIN